MSKSNFGTYFSEAMQEIHREREADRTLFNLVFDGLERFEDRHKFRHTVVKTGDTSGELIALDDAVCRFRAEAGKVVVEPLRLQTAPEAFSDVQPAIKRMGRFTAELVTARDDASRVRRR